MHKLLSSLTDKITQLVINNINNKNYCWKFILKKSLTGWQKNPVFLGPPGKDIFNIVSGTSFPLKPHSRINVCVCIYVCIKILTSCL